MTPLSPLSANRRLPVDALRLQQQVLPAVFKPGRYLGMEQGAYRKPMGHADIAMALAFPDLYEIGISSYGHKLLYSLVNQQPGFLCDRVYAPAQDFAAQLKAHELPLYGVETLVPLRDFDVVAFSLQYELNYTTILGMLESAWIPLRAAERPTLDWPLLIAGGPGSSNPLPLAPFFDAFMVGDGEEVLVEVLETVRDAKRAGLDKAALMQRLAKLEGVYIPTCNWPGLTPKASKRIVDIAKTQIDIAPLIPSVGAVHDRVTIEARRGCDRMCRFCQPCFINLPVREQSIDAIKTSALAELEKTGYEECSLLSLSIADYSHLKPLVTGVATALEAKNASLSLPSQRADRFNLEVAEAVQSVRKSTLTFAPEAGTPRLRDVINKNLTDAEIMNAVTTAYRAGWNKVKLYFIIGLPTETTADLDGIVELVQRMRDTCREIRREPGLSIKSHLEVNITLSNFVPKPHTPFQWFPQDTMETLREKIAHLRQAFRPMRGVKVNYTDVEISKLEAAIAKGDEALADVLETAYRNGSYLDAWGDPESLKHWFAAFEAQGIDVEAYTRHQWVDPDGPLPWDVIDVGLDKAWLKNEFERAQQAASTTPCFDACSACGVCATYGTWPSFMEPPEESSTTRPNAIQPVEAEAPVLKRLPVIKARLKLEKRGTLRFISHLDWLRLLQRAVARAKVPVAYSQGFNPKPKLSFGPALPMFMASRGEYVDIELTASMPDIAQTLNPFLPEGGKVLSSTLLPLSAPGIEKSIRALAYSAQWTCNPTEKEYTLRERVAFLNSQPSLPVEVEIQKNRKSLDLLPYLSALSLDGDASVQFQIRRLGNESGQPVSVHPQWVLGLVDPDAQWQIVRTDIELASFSEEPVCQSGV